MAEYEIGQRLGICHVTQRPLEEGEEFYAVLFETSEGFERRDYSLECWSGPPEGYFSYWKARIPIRQQKKRLFVDNAVMINLFQRLEEIQDPVKLQFRFVLALLLMRKRLLKYLHTDRQEGTEFWVMRLTNEPCEYKVLNPQLDESQIESVTAELSAILHGEVLGETQNESCSPVKEHETSEHTESIE